MHSLQTRRDSWLTSDVRWGYGWVCERTVLMNARPASTAFSTSSKELIIRLVDQPLPMSVLETVLG
jgi:hypothetical protein